MRTLRKLLLPLSFIYGIVIFIRNYLYDKGVLASSRYDFPLICIGNLSVGGTGKTPMTEYVVSLLQKEHKVAILSRGYKRASKGFLLAGEGMDVRDLGDEPMQYFKKFPDVKVAVDGDRRHGISKLRATTNTGVVVLDDAFQHRKVKAGLNILLTVYDNLYTDDYLLPAGNLRDSRSQAARAEVVVVTKCPPALNGEQRRSVRQRLKLNDKQELFFSYIAYNDVLYGKEQRPLKWLQGKNFTLVTGIARPEPLVEYLKANGLNFEHLRFKDHHNFTPDEIGDLRKKQLVITTEKDYTRLESQLEHLYYLPIRLAFLERAGEFDKILLSFALGG